MTDQPTYDIDIEVATGPESSIHGYTVKNVTGFKEEITGRFYILTASVEGSEQPHIVRVNLDQLTAVEFVPSQAVPPAVQFAYPDDETLIVKAGGMERRFNYDRHGSAGMDAAKVAAAIVAKAAGMKVEDGT